MFKVASLNGNGTNQVLLNMNNLVEGNIHGGVINNTTGTKQNVIFLVGTIEFPLRVEANSTTSVSKINVPSSTTVRVNAPTGVNVSVSYIETASDAGSALTTVQELVNEANTSATNAAISKTNASNSATNANLSAASANESKTNAGNSEIMASKWAKNPEDVEVLTGQYSAYHWARKSQAVASGDVIEDGIVSDLLTWSSEKINSLDVAIKEYVDTGAGVPFVANDTRVKTALNATGNAPIYACRAWVNFNGTGSVSIRASGNVSSITNNGVGDYNINFTTAMIDSNYSVNGTSTTDPLNNTRFLLVTQPNNLSIPTASSVRLQSRAASTGNPSNSSYFFVAIFR